MKDKKQKQSKDSREGEGHEVTGWGAHERKPKSKRPSVASLYLLASPHLITININSDLLALFFLPLPSFHRVCLRLPSLDLTGSPESGPAAFASPAVSRPRASDICAGGSATSNIRYLWSLSLIEVRMGHSCLLHQLPCHFKANSVATRGLSPEWE
ncbi:uncharacterized protein LOC116259638 [Nymphaea colorata]|nr:uncharacterized protein LOC116259638 [Nymphaea colorata]